MAKREYGQFCGLAHALELVGERWGLLIIRDLLVGPRRFTDLHRGLPKIPTNILSTRLKELEASGVIQRRILPRPERGVVYELTAYGADLEDVVLGLGLWGARTLPEPRAGEIATPDSLIMALRATFRPEPARNVAASFQLHLDDTAIYATVDHGTLETAQGIHPRPNLTIHTGPQLRALMTGELKPRDAIARHQVRLEGSTRLLNQFVEIFHIPDRSEPIAVS